MENLTQKELLDLYTTTSINSRQIKNRQKAFILSWDQNLPTEGIIAKSKIKTIQNVIISTQSVTGQVANPGKVIGKAKLMTVDYSNLPRIKREIDKMSQGDILIAESTAPELILACKKAGAIVTDLGGLMSHAAIIAREMKIPCVVGTQSATKIFKNGDLVEVNATKGVIRKLS